VCGQTAGIRRHCRFRLNCVSPYVALGDREEPFLGVDHLNGVSIFVEPAARSRAAVLHQNPDWPIDGHHRRRRIGKRTVQRSGRTQQTDIAEIRRETASRIVDSMAFQTVALAFKDQASSRSVTHLDGGSKRVEASADISNNAGQFRRLHRERGHACAGNSVRNSPRKILIGSYAPKPSQTKIDARNHIPSQTVTLGALGVVKPCAGVDLRLAILPGMVLNGWKPPGACYVPAEKECCCDE